MRSRRLVSAFVIAGLVLIVGSEVVSATPLMGPMRQQKIARITNDRGGYLIEYVARLRKLREAGTQVQFTGPCLSACTIYLALPKSQICASPRASFGFHAPYGAGPKGNQIALYYMLNTYPGWVREWISSRGGLSRRLITMQFAYASKYVRTCGTVTAENELRGFNRGS